MSGGWLSGVVTVALGPPDHGLPGAPLRLENLRLKVAQLEHPKRKLAAAAGPRPSVSSAGGPHCPISSQWCVMSNSIAGSPQLLNTKEKKINEALFKVAFLLCFVKPQSREEYT